MKRAHKHPERERVGGPFSDAHWHGSEGEQDSGALARPGEPGTRNGRHSARSSSSPASRQSRRSRTPSTRNLLDGERLGEVAVRRGWATQEQIAILLADQWQLRYLGTEALAVDLTALRLLPIAAVRELDAVPIGFTSAACSWPWPSPASICSLPSRSGSTRTSASPWSRAWRSIRCSGVACSEPRRQGWTRTPRSVRSPRRPSRSRVEPTLDAPEAAEDSAFATGEGEPAVSIADREPPQALDEDREPSRSGRTALLALAEAATAVADEPAASPRPSFELPAGSSPTRPAAVALAAA